MPDPKAQEERDPLDRIAEEFSEQLRSGRPVTISEVLERHPEHRAELQELLPTVELIESLKARRGPAGAAPVQLPERLGDFRILREIGRGGMGIVYEAEQISLGRRVALKVLPRPLKQDQKRQLRFEQEARVAAGLHHTNIVPVFGVGEEQGLRYYAMQFIDGLGLDEILKDLRARRLAPDTGRPKDQRRHLLRSVRRPAGRPYFELVARIGLQVALALRHAHRQGALHRDIKPANLILDRRGRVWITDFGVARLTGEPGLTRTGDLVGTPQYLAPEGLRGEWDERTDIYGLGATLYELCTWEKPYGEDSAAQLLERLRAGALDLPRRVNPEIPVDLETVVLKAAAADPRHRYAQAGELADDLRRFLEDRPVRARRVSPPVRLLRWCRRNRTVAALSATAALSLLLAAALGWIGYAETRRALGSESARRDEAEAATRRANANVELSLSALENIFEHLAPDRPADRGRKPPPGEPGFELLDREDNLELIQSMLGFYEKFAAENATGAGLKLEAARAYNRVAEIQRRLGRNEESAQAFERSEELLLRLRMESPLDTELLYLLADTTLRLAATDATDVSQVGADALTARLDRTRSDVEWLLSHDPGPRSQELKHRFRVRSSLLLVQVLLNQERPAEARDLLLAAIAGLSAPPASPASPGSMTPEGPGRPIGPEARRWDPAPAELYRALAEVYDRLGDQDAARRAARESKSHEAPFRGSEPPPRRPAPERPGRRR